MRSCERAPEEANLFFFFSLLEPHSASVHLRNAAFPSAFVLQGASALFDMIEYYESATHLNISFNKHIGTRGWQAAAHMMRKVCAPSQIFFGTCFNPPQPRRWAPKTPVCLPRPSAWFCARLAGKPPCSERPGEAQAQRQEFKKKKKKQKTVALPACLEVA